MRDINQLHPTLQTKLYQLMDLCDKNGITIGIGECLRTRAEQNALYAQGRTAPGNIVTNCRGDSYSSMHQWGVAFDFYLKMDVDGDGKVTDDAFNNSTGLFNKVGALGKSVGLEWGGDWKSIKDNPHFQLPDWGSTATQLKKLFGTPDAFMKTWSTTSAPVVSQPVTSGNETNDGTAYVTATSGLNIRSTPNSSNAKNKIGSIPYKATCFVKELDVANANGLSWARVLYNGVEGYVAQKYLNVTAYPKTNPITTSASSSGESGYSKSAVDKAMSLDQFLAATYKTTANLNLRTGAGTNKGIILTIPAGSLVSNYGFYTQSGNTKWLLVAYGSYVGYCSQAYLAKHTTA